MSQVLFYSVSGILGIAFIITLILLYRTLKQLSHVETLSEFEIASKDGLLELKEQEINNLKEENEALKERLDEKTKKKRNVKTRKVKGILHEQMDLFEVELSEKISENTKLDIEIEPSTDALDNLMDMPDIGEAPKVVIPDVPLNPVFDEEVASKLRSTLLLSNDEPRFGHPDRKLDTDPSRQLQPVKRASSLSTASASASTLSTWD
jgi:hypothetical protein